MYQSISESDFIEAFRDMNREENFTVAGRRALFEYLEQLEEDTCSPMELDVIGLCCDYSELTLEDAINDYGDHIFDMDELNGLEEDEKITYIKDILHEHTTIIEVGDDSFIIQAF